MLEVAEYSLKNFAVNGSVGLLDHLRCARPKVVPATSIHGDYTTNNVIVENGKVTGIIDWCWGAVGDLRYDLALATEPEIALTKEDVEAFYDGYSAPHSRRKKDVIFWVYASFFDEL
jgi:aminoglycoside phosphotransferase (APT) family kinase protein